MNLAVECAGGGEFVLVIDVFSSQNLRLFTTASSFYKLGLIQMCTGRDAGLQRHGDLHGRVEE